MSTLGADDFTVRPYRPGDEDAIAEVLASLLGRRPSPEWWQWQFRDVPGGPALIDLLEHDGRVVGHHAHVGFDAFVDGRRLRMSCCGPLVVLPEYRGRGGMGRLVKAFLASDHGFALRASFPYENAHRLAQRQGTTTSLGHMPRWIRWLSTDAPAGPRMRPMVRSGAMKRYSAAASWPPPKVAVEPLDELGPELDELAVASASIARCIRVRDAAYVRWRWCERPTGELILQAARAPGGSLRGFVVSSAAGDGFGRIVDVLAHDPQTLRALLLHATKTLAARGCTRAVLDYQDPRPWARAAVMRSGFLPWGEGINVIASSMSEAAGSAPEQLASWYLTAGDTERV